MKFNKLFALFLSSLILNTALNSMAKKSLKWSELWYRDSAPATEVKDSLNGSKFFGPARIGGWTDDIILKHTNISQSDIPTIIQDIKKRKTALSDDCVDLVEHVIETELSGWLKKRTWNEPVDYFARYQSEKRNQSGKSITMGEYFSGQLRTIKNAKIAVGMIYALLASGCIVGAYKLIQYIKSKLKKEKSKNNISPKISAIEEFANLYNDGNFAKNN